MPWRPLHEITSLSLTAGQTCIWPTTPDNVTLDGSVVTADNYQCGSSNIFFAIVEWSLEADPPVPVGTRVRVRIEGYSCVAAGDPQDNLQIRGPDGWEPGYNQAAAVYVPGPPAHYAKNSFEPDTIEIDGFTDAILFAAGSWAEDFPAVNGVFTFEYEEPVVPDTTNCECEDNTQARSMAELRMEMLTRLGYASQAEQIMAGEESAWPPGMKLLLTSFLRTANTIMGRQYPELRTERFFRWALQQGVRHYDVRGNDNECPPKLDPLKVTWAGVERDGVWYPLICGIPPEVYTLNSEQSWPTRYEIRSCIEIWPPPSADAGTLQIKGHFENQPFEDDEDKPTANDEVVFLWAMAGAKAHLRHPDAGAYADQASGHIRNLVAGLHQTRRYVPGERQTTRLEPEPRADGVDLWGIGGPWT